MKRTFLLSILVSLVCSLVQAAPPDCSLEKLTLRGQPTPFTNGSIRPATPAERAAWTSALRQALNLSALSGQNQISWLNFSGLESQVDKVTLCLNTSSEAVVGSASRTGGVYLVEQKTVLLNLSRIQELNQNPGAGIMLMHEFCGALGCPDENFEITSFLYLNAHRHEIGEVNVQAAEKALSRHLDQNAVRTRNTRFSSGGGASGVGGGGDPFLGMIKAVLMVRVVTNQSLFGASFDRAMDAALRLDLEPDDFPTADAPIMKSMFPGMGIGRSGDRLYITIDTPYWNRIREDSNVDHREDRTIFIDQLILLTCAMNGIDMPMDLMHVGARKK